MSGNDFGRHGWHESKRYDAFSQYICRIFNSNSCEVFVGVLSTDAADKFELLPPWYVILSVGRKLDSQSDLEEK